METTNFGFQASNGHWYDCEYSHVVCDFSSDEIDDDNLSVYDELGLQVTEETNIRVIKQIKNYLINKYFIMEDAG